MNGQRSTQKSYRNFVFSVIALCASVLIGSGALFAWFLTSKEASVGGIENQVVSVSDVTVDMTVDGSKDILTFEGATPGKIYACRFKLTRQTEEPITACIDFLDIVAGLLLEPGRYDGQKSLLNVFGVSTAENASADADFISLVQLAADPGQPADFDHTKDIRVRDNIPFPADSDVVELVLYLKFLEFPVDEAGQRWTENGTDGKPLGDSVIVNQFQGQTFEIGTIRVGRGSAEA